MYQKQFVASQEVTFYDEGWLTDLVVVTVVERKFEGKALADLVVVAMETHAQKVGPFS